MGERDRHHHARRINHPFQRDVGVIAADIPRRPQAVQPRPAGRRRQIHEFGQFGLAQLPMLLDGTENANIRWIETLSFSHILTPYGLTDTRAALKKTSCADPNVMQLRETNSRWFYDILKGGRVNQSQAPVPRPNRAAAAPASVYALPVTTTRRIRCFA
jgi:hypothetical protein